MSAGTNVLALTVPQPLATSNPGAAVRPGTRTCPVFGSMYPTIGAKWSTGKVQLHGYLVIQFARSSA